MPYTRILSINELNPNIGYNSTRESFFISNDLMLEVPFFITYTGEEIEVLLTPECDVIESYGDVKIVCDKEFAEMSFQTKEDIMLYDLQEFNKRIREVS
jgi:hypothetical protein